MSGVSAEISDLLPFTGDIFRSQGFSGRKMDSFGSFPSDTSSESRSDFKQGTSCRTFITSKENNCRSNVVGFEFCNDFFWHDCSSHVCSCGRCNGVDEDVVLLSFSCESPREAYDCKLGRRIIGLSKVTVDT